MKRWGVKQWSAFAYDSHPFGQRAGSGSRSTPFLADAWPGFDSYIDRAALEAGEAAMRNFAQLCDDAGIEFWYGVPFPMFPVQDDAVVRKVLPDLYKSGRMNIYDPRLAELVKNDVRALKKGLPNLKGVQLWLCEGGGSGVEFTREDLLHLLDWQTPLARTFNEVTQELGIGGIIFAHHYLHTVATHRNVYKMMAEFPELILMEDITWPAEDMQHQFLAYLNHADRELLFQVNPVALNFLIDTEYTGEGVLPSVYPRWWKLNVAQAIRSGAKIAMGRVFYWDNGYTDVNFNRLNAHIFARFCYEPDADPRQLLGEAAQEMFGNQIPERLVDILWQTEPVLKNVVGVNGIYELDHSRFPQAYWMDILYTPQNNAMFAIDDLFTPPGSVLYPPYSDDLVNLKQWRWQNKTVSKPAAAYLAEKQAAISWVESVLPEVRELARELDPHHGEMFVHGYEMLLVLAKGIALYIETAATHYAWARGKTLDDPAAKVQFHTLADRFRALAAQADDRPFLYKTRMLAFADFLENGLPRLSPQHKVAS